MNSKTMDQAWEQHSVELLRGLQAWRRQHPQATFQAIETALDERLDRVRARMLEAAAEASVATDWRGAPEAAQPHCPHCAVALRPRGRRKRRLRRQGDQELVLTRTYGVCPSCALGVFPPR